jgi:hypothetical protein
MFKRFFAEYVRRTLHLLTADEPPVAGLKDLERTMQVVDAAYASSAAGSCVRPTAPI